MVTLLKFKKIMILTPVVLLNLAFHAQSEAYEWLKSPGFESIFVYTDFKECDFIAEKLSETVKRTFSRSSIRATISNSLIFKTEADSNDSVYELVDEELTGNNKIILHIYGKCVKYSSGFVYQFDINFGVNDAKHSQALLYATPRHSVIGVDSITGIDSAFRTLMRNVVDDYWFANQEASGL